MNISLPDCLHEHVRRRVAEGGFANASDYVRSLIREDFERQEKDEQTLRLARSALHAEPEATEAYWRELEAEASQRLADPNKR
jgi:putative addiction module CopG family antidote